MPVTLFSPASRTESSSLTHEVKRTLLAWLRDGKYPPGSRLPSVPEMVKQLNVSRTVVREALQSLVGMNLVEMRPGLGCFVNHIPANLIVNADVLASLLGMNAIVEVVAARRVIEGAVARQVCLHASEEDLAKIEEALKQIEATVRRDEPMFARTPDFHVAVARATHNKILENIVSSFNLLMAAGGALIEKRNPTKRYRMQEYESHKALLEVLRSRDPNAAQSAMEDHIGKTLTALHRIEKEALKAAKSG